MSLLELYTYALKPALVGLGALIVTFVIGAFAAAGYVYVEEKLKERVQIVVPRWLDITVKTVLAIGFVWALGMLLTTME